MGLGVGQGSGVPPGGGNSAAATARMAVRSGTSDDPYWVDFDATSGWRITTRVTAFDCDLVDERRQLWQALDRQVRPDGRADRVEQLGEPEQERPVLRRRGAERHQDLLLPGGSGEVALAERLAGAGVGERLDAVEMVVALGDRETALWWRP